MAMRAGVGPGRCLAIVDPLPCRICIGEPTGYAVSTRVPRRQRSAAARGMGRRAIVEAETHCSAQAELDVRLSNADSATDGKQGPRKRGRAQLLGAP